MLQIRSRSGFSDDVHGLDGKKACRMILSYYTFLSGDNSLKYS